MKNQQIDFFDIPNFIEQSNPDIEELVLGCFINWPDTYTNHADAISLKDFSRPENRIIFYAIRDLTSRNRKIDIFTVCNFIKKNRWDIELEERSKGYNVVVQVEDICDRISTDEHIKDHIQELNEFAKRRELSTLSDKIANKCNEFDHPDEIIEVVSQELYSIQEMGDVDDETGLDTIQNWVKAKEKNEDAEFIYTGISTVDEFTGGFKFPDQIIIAAKASMGKTSLVLQIFDYNIKKGVPCAFFSLEMDSIQLLDRMAALNSGVEISKLRKNHLNRHDWDKMHRYIAKIEDKTFFIDDRSSKLSTITNKIKKWVIRNKVKFVVIDYLQLVICDTNANNREQEIATISRQLKSLARELKIVIFALSQLNRNNAGRSDKRPILSDLRESGSIEQDADVVMFIHREEYYQPGLNSRVENAEVIFAKGRSIGVGSVDVMFQSSTTKFYGNANDLPEHEQQALAQVMAMQMQDEASQSKPVDPENHPKDLDTPF